MFSPARTNPAAILFLVLIISTLPILPFAQTQSFDPSPYNPASRLFWNEFYIDISKVPGFFFQHY